MTSSQDVYSWKVKALVSVVGRLARLVRFVDLDDQVEACQRVFASDTRWTVVRGSDLEELVHEAPAIVGCQTPSALAHAANRSPALR